MKYVIEVLVIDVAIRSGLLRQLNDSGYQLFVAIYLKAIVSIPAFCPISKLSASVSQSISINLVSPLIGKKNFERFRIDDIKKGAAEVGHKSVQKRWWSRWRKLSRAQRSVKAFSPEHDTRTSVREQTTRSSAMRNLYTICIVDPVTASVRFARGKWKKKEERKKRNGTENSRNTIAPR